MLSRGAPRPMPQPAARSMTFSSASLALRVRGGRGALSTTDAVTFSRRCAAAVRTASSASSTSHVPLRWDVSTRSRDRSPRTARRNAARCAACRAWPARSPARRQERRQERRGTTHATRSFPRSTRRAGRARRRTGAAPRGRTSTSAPALQARFVAASLSFCWRCVVVACAGFAGASNTCRYLGFTGPASYAPRAAYAQAPRCRRPSP